MKGVRKDFYDACDARASIETNYPQGGDSGHGGETWLEIENLASTSMCVEVTETDGMVFQCDVLRIRLGFKGDAEARILRRMLGWAALQLDEMTDNQI